MRFHACFQRPNLVKILTLDEDDASSNSSSRSSSSNEEMAAKLEDLTFVFSSKAARVCVCVCVCASVRVCLCLSCCLLVFSHELAVVRERFRLQLQEKERRHSQELLRANEDVEQQRRQSQMLQEVLTRVPAESFGRPHLSRPACQSFSTSQPNLHMHARIHIHAHRALLLRWTVCGLQKLDELMSDKHATTSSLTSAQEKIRQLRKHIAQERFARAADFARHSVYVCFVL